MLLGERMFVFGGNAAQVRRPAAACAHPIPPLECFRARFTALPQLRELQWPSAASLCHAFLCI